MIFKMRFIGCMFCWFLPHLFAIAAALMIDKAILSGCNAQPPVDRLQPKRLLKICVMYLDLFHSPTRHAISSAVHIQHVSHPKLGSLSRNEVSLTG